MSADTSRHKAGRRSGTHLLATNSRFKLKGANWDGPTYIYPSHEPGTVLAAGMLERTIAALLVRRPT